jgi:hypothetical protein
LLLNSLRRVRTEHLSRQLDKQQPAQDNSCLAPIFLKSEPTPSAPKNPLRARSCHWPTFGHKASLQVGHQLLKTLWKISAKELKIIQTFLCGDWHFSLNPLICSSALVCFSDHSYVHLVTLSSSRVLSSGPDEFCFFFRDGSSSNLHSFSTWLKTDLTEIKSA